MGSSVLICAVLPAVPPLCLMKSELSHQGKRLEVNDEYSCISTDRELGSL